MGTLKFENYWFNPKTDLVDPHWTKNGQNAPSWSVISVSFLEKVTWNNLLITYCMYLKFYILAKSNYKYDDQADVNQKEKNQFKTVNTLCNSNVAKQ